LAARPVIAVLRLAPPATARSRFSINDFGSDSGVDFYAAIEVAGSSKEKQDLRSAARPAAAPQPAST
jgi:hypothetical protein